jgi:hypothetical protein
MKIGCMRNARMSLILYSSIFFLANLEVEESGPGQDVDEGDDLIVDITSGPRTIAEEGYSLPVIIDPEDDTTTK